MIDAQGAREGAERIAGVALVAGREFRVEGVAKIHEPDGGHARGRVNARRFESGAIFTKNPRGRMVAAARTVETEDFC